ncbi:MAG: hypothetical protein M0R17_00540 [Candidatus Omnitrophica bacterium]|jgi:hypothetical protein|nr:hypothetical protein [Candidatus Omnitrophota bacterium]
MISTCTAKLGTAKGVTLTSNAILACSCRESLGNLPNGRLVIKTPSTAIDDFLNLPSNLEITITISSFEKSDGSDLTEDTTKVIHGTIVKHFNSHKEANMFSTYVIEFITCGENMSYLALLKGQAIYNDSIHTIKKLCDGLGITLNISTNTVNTNDIMKWLIVNKNFAIALDSILAHSYVSSDDALYLAYKLDGTIKIGAIGDELNNQTSYLLEYGKNKKDIVNKTSKDGNYNTLSYYDFNTTNSAAIGSLLGTQGFTGITPPGKKNKKTSSTSGVTPGSQTDTHQKTGMIDGVLPSIDVTTKANPNTHEYYGIAPKVRSSVYGKYSHKLELFECGESVISIGDAVNVLVPTIGTMSADVAQVTFSKALSGKYFVTAKNYYFGNGARFESSIELVKSSNFIENADSYLTAFGISKDRIK